MSWRRAKSAHLARELHDSVTQALFSMTLVSRSVEMLLEKDPAGARDQLTQLRDLQREALAEMRALIFELRPGNLEQDGLVRALKTHAGALQGRLGLPIVVESDLTDRLPLPAEEVLYRIAQEALHNVVKHAAAHSVRVEVRREGPLSDCGSKTTARASTPPGSRTDISGSPGCVHARSASGRCSRARAHTRPRNDGRGPHGSGGTGGAGGDDGHAFRRVARGRVDPRHLT